jgi:hypothetical protein
MSDNIIPFRRKPGLVWKDDGRVHERGDGKIYLGFVADIADCRYEIAPCYRMKNGSGFAFSGYTVICRQGFIGTWTNVGSFSTIDTAKAAAEAHAGKAMAPA